MNLTVCFASCNTTAVGTGCNVAVVIVRTDDTADVRTRRRLNVAVVYASDDITAVVCTHDTANVMSFRDNSSVVVAIHYFVMDQLTCRVGSAVRSTQDTASYCVARFYRADDNAVVVAVFHFVSSNQRRLDEVAANTADKIRSGIDRTVVYTVDNTAFIITCDTAREICSSVNAAIVDAIFNLCFAVPDDSADRTFPINRRVILTIYDVRTKLPRTPPVREPVDLTIP